MSEENTSNEIELLHEIPQMPVVATERTTIGKLVRRTIFDLNEVELARLKIMAEMYAASAFNHKKDQGKGDFFLIMMKGLELGIAPMAAVDTINIIAGKPVLDAKGQLALVKSSGLLEDIQIDSNAERCIVTLKRVGESPHMSSFTIHDANTFMTTEWVDKVKKQIPLSQKSNWKSQPAVMLKWRAVTAALREVFPDVLSGLYNPEEMDSDNTIVEYDGSMKLLSSTTTSAPDESRTIQFPEKKDEQPTPATPKAWHDDLNNLAALLGNCVAKGWIEGANIGEQKASFLSLVGKEVTSFETGKAANEAAEAAATAQAPQPNESKEAWDTFDAIQKIVDWAKEHGYGDSETALLRLLGIPDWKAFDSGKEACEEIAKAFKAKEPKGEETAEKGKLSDTDRFAIQTWAEEVFNLSASELAAKVDLSKYSTATTAKTIIRQKAENEGWPVVAEKCVYHEKPKFIEFITPLGPVRHYSRNKLAEIVGQEYVDNNGILTLPDGEETEIESLLINWEQKGSGDTAYKIVKSAASIAIPF